MSPFTLVSDAGRLTGALSLYIPSLIQYRHYYYRRHRRRRRRRYRWTSPRVTTERARRPRVFYTLRFYVSASTPVLEHSTGR